MSAPEIITTVALAREHDIVLARQRARQLAAILGFDRREQTSIATAVSEISRNAFDYGGGGKVAFAIARDVAPAEFVVTIIDDGPGIPDIDAVLTGRYSSPTGMGLGIVGTRRLMDRFEIENLSGGGTVATFAKVLPAGTDTRSMQPGAIGEALAKETFGGPVGELQQQNQELLRALDEVQGQQEELTRLNIELEETNRGVMALYSELDERAQELRRANELKTRFLAGVGHELRTPLSSVVALADLLLERADGELTIEQERQVTYIRGAAMDQLALVNDLLDAAQIESGKVAIRTGEFEVSELFAGLRGTLRPLLRERPVVLHFDHSLAGLRLVTDEGKLTQILRNLIANALKFTEAGTVRVAAELLDSDPDLISFTVTDTGIGIAEEHQESVFEEFTQVESPLQSGVRGTGLGLPLARRLTGLLGGRLDLESTPGVGSTLTVVIPIVFPAAAAADVLLTQSQPVAAGCSILIVDDEPRDRYLARQALLALTCEIEEAESVAAALAAIGRRVPDAIVLDLTMPVRGGMSMLEELQEDPRTRMIPIVVRTGKELDAAEEEVLERYRIPVVFKQDEAFVLAERVGMVLERRAVAATDRQT